MKKIIQLVREHTSFIKQFNIKIVLGMILFLSMSEILNAHEPLFMMSHEAPGRGAFDTHSSLQKNSLSNALELEQEFGWGLTRNLAVKFAIPATYIHDSNIAKTGLIEPTYRVKWRFWDADSLGQKLALAWGVKGNIPVGNNKGLILGSDNIYIENGIAQGLESLHFYYFVDLRYRKNFANLNKPSDQLHLDFSPGWRPFVRKIDQTDVVFFIEVNYVHYFLGLIENKLGVQDIVYVTPDILISPSNRVMLRAGVQIPVYKRFKAVGPTGTNFKTSMELRF